MRDLRFRHLAAIGVALFLLLSGCAGHEETFKATGPAGHKVKVEMKASSFDFDPAVIAAQKGQTLILDMRNVSGIAHNITVKDPSGTIMKSQDIPANQSISMEIFLPTAGVYPFYCDKPFHPTFGMKGRIEVK